MATAGKEVNLEVTVSSGGKEREPYEYSRIVADLINYCGNTIVLLEVVLLSFLAIELMVHNKGWLGVALVVFLAPASIMILLLTRILKNEFLEKYTKSNASVSVEFPGKHVCWKRNGE